MARSRSWGLDPTVQADEADESPPPSRGTVLVAEGQDDIRRLFRATLERAGFAVLTAENGAEALCVFSEHLHEIDLVLLDFSIPVLKGEVVFRDMRSARDELPVILCGGYADWPAVTSFAESEVIGVLAKPCSTNGLVDRVQGTLRAVGEQR